jgi:nucleotide-binding universal stress UspA family protein
MSSGIVIGYDGSECAKEALRVALEVGKAYGDRVVIVYGFEINPLGGGEIHEYRSAVREVASERLKEAIAIASKSGSDGIDVEAVIVEHAPAPGLAELARERDARVIVVGTRGESPFRGALLGSTPHKLLHLADRPVLVVPGPGGG